MDKQGTTKPLLIYLADPTHDGSGRPAVEIFPYNIGVVASYAKKMLGDAVDIRLFKYVMPLLAAIKDEPPDIMGCSNYCWNSQISHFVCRQAKEANPETVTVFGGTNYPFDALGQLEFLSQRPAVDFHLFYEGEHAFVNLVNSLMALRNGMPMPRNGANEFREKPIDGCQSISPTTGKIVSGNALARIKNLDDVPSPYATGLLDEFFDGLLTPLIETNRGCPFTCNFCNAGTPYYQKINMFSTEYLREEWTYIAPRIAAAGVTNVQVADNNFGMYPRDGELCQILSDLKDEYGWPQRVVATTGKNHKERILENFAPLGNNIGVNMSAQSMNPEVLTLIKRQNVSLQAYKDINEEMLKRGQVQKGELIAGLPGETFDSFMNGLRQMIDMGTQQVYSYTLSLLYGTDYKDADYRKEWGYQGKWRIVPQDFGEYHGHRIFDAEEVAVESKSLSFDEYIKIRLVCLLTEAMYNEYEYYEFIKYLGQAGVSPIDWILKALHNMDQAPESVRQVVDSFVRDTNDELFDSEEELTEYFQSDANYQKLVSGEAGHNVVMSHKGLLISSHSEEWVGFIAKACMEAIIEKGTNHGGRDEMVHEIEETKKYLCAKWVGVLNEKGDVNDIHLGLDYDILEWLADESNQPMARFLKEESVSYRFYFTELQLKQRVEEIWRFGYNRHGFGKLYSRGMSLHPFRYIEHSKATVV